MTEIPASIRALSDYWHRLGGGSAPDRSRLDLIPIQAFLPFILLVEFEDRPFRVRYRLTGTKVDEMTGLNITGRHLDEFARGIYRDVIVRIQECYASCRTTGQPVIESYHWPSEENFTRLTWMGLFPLRVDGEIRQCLAIEDYGQLGPQAQPYDWRQALE